MEPGWTEPIRGVVSTVSFLTTGAGKFFVDIDKFLGEGKEMLGSEVVDLDAVMAVALRDKAKGNSGNLIVLYQKPEGDDKLIRILNILGYIN